MSGKVSKRDSDNLVDCQYLSQTRFCLFVFMLLNVPVNSYGHVGTVAFDFVGLLPDIEMNFTPSPAILPHPSKQLWLIRRDDPI